MKKTYLPLTFATSIFAFAVILFSNVVSYSNNRPKAFISPTLSNTPTILLPTQTPVALFVSPQTATWIDSTPSTCNFLFKHPQNITISGINPKTNCPSKINLTYTNKREPQQYENGEIDMDIIAGQISDTNIFEYFQKQQKVTDPKSRQTFSSEYFTHDGINIIKNTGELYDLGNNHFIEYYLEKDKQYVQFLGYGTSYQQESLLDSIISTLQFR